MGLQMQISVGQLTFNDDGVRCVLNACRRQIHWVDQ